MRRLLIAALAIIAAVAVAVLAAPFVVPDDVVKTRLAALVRQQTGRELRISGPLRFSLVPAPRVTAQDIALANHPGDYSGDVLTVATATAWLRPLALLRGQIEVERLELARPLARLEIDAQGRRNWIFHPQHRPPGSGGSASSDGMSGPMTVVVSGGELRYRDRRSGREQAATEIALTLGWPAAGPLHATGTAIYSGESVGFTADLAAPRNLQQQRRASGAMLSIVSPRASVAFHGEIGGMSAADGSVELKAPSLPALLSWLRLPLAARVSGSLSVGGRIQGGGARWSLRDAKIALGSTVATGMVAIDGGGVRPRLSGQLAFSRLDLRSAPKQAPEASAGAAASAVSPVPASPVAPAAAAPAAAPPAAEWSKAPIDLAPLKFADAGFELTADRARLGRIELGASRATLRLNDGRLDLEIAAAALYGGTGSGKLVVDGSGRTPGFGARFNLTGVTLPPMPIEVAGLGYLSGTGDIAVDIIGRGTSVREIVASLNGIVGFQLTDGTLGSAGLGPLMRDALGPAVDDAPVPREIDYRSLSATATVAHGIVRNGDLRLAAPRLSATGSGTFDLAARRLDYLWQPNIPGIGSARIAVSGVWDAPIYRALSVTITKLPTAPARGPP